MAAPTINHDFTTFNDASTDPGTGWGQNSGKWDPDGDIYIEGSASLGCQPSALGDGGNGYTGTSFDATARLILVWVYVVTEAFVNTFDNYGIYIRLGSGASWTDYYSDFKVGGSDVAWTGKGWRLVVLDANRTADRNGTNPVSKTAVTRVGVGFNCSKTSSKSTALAIDAIRHGTSFEVTGSIATTGVNLSFTASGSIITRASGSFATDGYAVGDIIYVRGSTNNDGRYTVASVGTTTMAVEEDLVDESSAAGRTIDAAVMWADVIAWDIGTSIYNYGIVRRNPLGVTEVNFPITLGDVSGSNRLAFESRNEVVYFTDQVLVPASSSLKLITAKDSSAVTRVFFGSSVNTGDDRVGFAGPTYSKRATVFAGKPYLDFDVAITELGLFGATLLEVDGASVFPTTTGSYYITTTTFAKCGQVDVGRAQCRGLIFSGYEGTDGALLWNENIDIKASKFLRNSRGVEHPSYSGSPYTYTALEFAGNTYDVNNTSGNGITINVPGVSNPTTYTGSSVSFASTVTLTVTVQDANRDPIELAQTSIWLLASPYTQLMNEDTDSDGIATEEYGGSTPVDVVVKVRKSDVYDSPRYTPYSAVQTIGDGGLSLTVTLQENPVL